MAYENIIKYEIDGLEQAKDQIVILELSLPEGVTETSLLALAVTDKARLSFRKDLNATIDLYTLTTEAGDGYPDIVIKPAERQIWLYFTDTASYKFPIGDDNLIVLYGTLLVEDTTQADPRIASRPCSKQNIKITMIPSFTRPTPTTPPVPPAGSG